ncbi:MAG: STM2901 family protein, partial [Trinickia sp.]
TKIGLKGVRTAFTRNLGAFVGRSIPLVGEVFLARDAFLIIRNTVVTYNRLAQPADRVPL